MGKKGKTPRKEPKTAPPKKEVKTARQKAAPSQTIEPTPPPPLPPPVVAPPSPSLQKADDDAFVEDFFRDDAPLACLEDSGAKRRQVDRRDTDLSASRAIEERLIKHFGKAVIEGATNKSVARIHGVVSMQMRANRSEKKNLASRFWDSIVTDFGLKSICVTDQLPLADTDESVSTDVFEKLGSAHCDNPAQRSTEPLERFLDHIIDLSYRELHGIICASMESQKIVRAASTRMLLSVLKYIAR